MKLNIINFSDVHFVDGENSIIDKKEKLIRAIKSRVEKDDKVLFIMNGDSTFSGNKQEYNIAFEFFADIIGNFDKADFLCVPGNHDCNFREMDTEIRETILQKIKDDTEKKSTLMEKVILQDEFNEYFEIFQNAWEFSELIEDHLLIKSIDYNISEKEKVRINLINSAWDSTLNEKPGTMYMPISEFDKLSYQQEAVFNISVVHHPTHWLEPNNKREFDQLLENFSDFILTGHEHQGTSVSKFTNYGETFILEGSVLQENYDSNISGFNMITMEIDGSKAEKVQLEQFEWDPLQTMYISLNTIPREIKVNTMVRKINHIANGEQNVFLMTEETKKYINDLGAPINHPRVGMLSLNDIYVYPDLKNSFEEKSSKQDIKSEDVVANINEDKGVWFIEGDKETGKTTLLKKMYQSFLNESSVPILLDAGLIKNANSLEKLEHLVLKEFSKQYIGNVYERFKQLNQDNKVILLDNWELCQLNKAGKKEILKKLTKVFGTIIIFANSAPNNASDILGLNEELETNIKFYEIKRFGYKKREEIIEKWLRYGNEFAIEESELIVEVDKYTKQVNEVIGKSFVPQVPIYILIILQSMDNGRDLTDFNNQSNGYYYELLIKQLVMSIGIDNNEISFLHNYLNHFAYKIFLSKERSLDYEEWNEFHQTYIKNYELDPQKMAFSSYMKKLLSSRIIKKFSDNRYSFSYNYALYFFAAQYLANHISEDLIKETVYNLIENINIEINANVLIFLTHLSKDEYILGSVIKISNQLLKDIPELMMEDDIKDLNQLMTELPTLVFKNTTVKENRRQYNETRDAKEDKDKHFLDDNSTDGDTSTEMSIRAKEEKGVLVEKNNILIEMDKAQRISEVIGQVLKNYSGSIVGETKRKLLDSAYNVSLRAGSKLIEIVNAEKDELVSFIAEKILEDKAIETANQREVERAAKRIVFKFVEMICFSIIQKSIKDTGSSTLKVTYDNFRKSELSMVKKLIISGSYLETMYINPRNSYLQENFNSTDKNLMAQSILQQMVAKYMYLFELPSSERQKIASSFNIRYDPVIKAKIDKLN